MARDEHGRAKRSQGGVGLVRRVPGVATSVDIGVLAGLDDKSRQAAGPGKYRCRGRHGSHPLRAASLAKTGQETMLHARSNAYPVPMTDRFAQALPTSALILGVACSWWRRTAPPRGGFGTRASSRTRRNGKRSA